MTDADLPSPAQWQQLLSIPLPRELRALQDVLRSMLLELEMRVWKCRLDCTDGPDLLQIVQEMSCERARLN